MYEKVNWGRWSPAILSVLAVIGIALLSGEIEHLIPIFCAFVMGILIGALWLR